MSEFTINILVGGTIQLGLTPELAAVLKLRSGAPIVINPDVAEAAALMNSGAFAEAAAAPEKTITEVVAEASAPAEKPAEKPAEPAAAPVEEPVKEVVEPEVIDKPQHTLDQLKKFCSQRKAEGINVAAIVRDIAGVGRFTLIPADKIDAVYDAIEKAEKE